MNQSQFWEVIEKTSHPDTEQQYLNILEALPSLTVENICHFGQYVSLYSSCSESPATYIACKLLNGSASDDTELYFRLWLIAQGKDIFFGTLKNPDKLIDLKVQDDYCEFEMLMSVAYTVLDEKVDNVEETMEQYAFTNAQVEKIAAEIETDMDWTEDEDSLWEQASLRAPMLYAKYHDKPETFNEAFDDMLSDDMLSELQEMVSSGEIESSALAEKILEITKKLSSDVATTSSAAAPPPTAKDTKQTDETIIQEQLHELAQSAAENSSNYEEIGPLSGGLILIKDANQKMGFIDKNDVVVIEPQYDSANDFHTALSCVSKNGKWGFINKKGEEVIPLIYEEISHWIFIEGLACVKKDGAWGAIDKKGNLIIPCLYELVSVCSEGIVFVGKEEKYAAVDQNGILRTDFIYDRVSVYRNGRAIFTRDNKNGILDENFNEILPPTYKQIESFFDYGFTLAIQKEQNDSYKMGFLDRNGNVIVPIIYDTIRRYERHPEKTIGFLGKEEVPLDMTPFVIEKPGKK